MASQNVLVTGGSSGIGLSVAELFLKKGAQVFNIDLKPGSFGQWIECDVAHVADVERCTKELLQKVGSVDVLVASAGIHFSGNLEDTTEEELDRLWSINVKGTYAVLHALLPSMKAAKKGAIVIVSSDQAFVGKRSSFAYNLTKAALASIVRTTALDYAPYGIRANAVCPGTIETPLYHKALRRLNTDVTALHASEAAQQPLGRIGQPHEVAPLIEFLASDKASFITGALYAIDGGYTTQ